MTVKVAVIGVGSMGQNHARVYSELVGVELVGVADFRPETAATVARRYRTAPYGDYLAMLDTTKPDAVTIAVPTSEHKAVALEVIKRGINLLIEKPISLTVEEGREIIAVADAAGVKLMIGHIERFNPAVIELKRRLAAGELGRVFQIDARRQGPFPSRIGDVGVVIDLAVHDLDLMRHISGAEVVRVSAETEHRIHSQYEDLLLAILRLSDGTVGSLTINWLTPTKIRELYVTGERGMFHVDYLTQDLYYYENANASGSEWDTLRVLRGVSEGRMIREVIAKKEPLRAELEAFIAAVRGDAPVAVTGLDGLRSLALAQVVVTSGRQHETIKCEPEIGA